MRKIGKGLALLLLFMLSLAVPVFAAEARLEISCEGTMEAGNTVRLTASLEGRPVAADWQLYGGDETVAIIHGNGTTEASLELLAPGRITLSAQTQDGIKSLNSPCRIYPAFTLTLPDGTGIEADNSGWVMIPPGQDRVFLEVYPALEVKDDTTGMTLNPLAGQSRKYEIIFNDTQAYSVSLENLNKSFDIYGVVAKRAQNGGKMAQRLENQTGAYSLLTLTYGEIAQKLNLCWQLDLPELDALSVEGAAFYSPFDLKALDQKFIFDKEAKRVEFRFTSAENLARAYIRNKSGQALEDRVNQRDGVYRFTINEDELIDGEIEFQLALENSLGQKRLINFKGYGRALDTPDRVVDYLCLGSQYSDGGNRLTGVYGLYPEKSLIGAGAWYTPISLGNFGGYITYYYEEPIKDAPQNPYGVDFIVYGNSNGGGGFSEPGNVLVSEDGEDWYTLAGSEHYEDMTKWNDQVVYSRTDEDYTAANGVSLKPYMYPSLENYPLYDWREGERDSITVSGTKLAFGETATGTYPAFGYVDVHTNGPGSWGTGEIKEVTVAAKNPYWPISEQETGLERPADLNGIYEGGGDCFDLAWAVDDQGLPVKLEEIHYIKAQTASLTLTVGGIGEKSTEVNGVTRARPNAEAVGESAPPAKISVGGQDIFPRDGVFEYTVDRPLRGPFGVEVEASPESNVYINNLRATERKFIFAPEKGLIRVIIQEGEKEPLLYFIKVNGQAWTREDTAKALEKTLAQSGGTAEDFLSRAQAAVLLYELSGQPEYAIPYRQYGQSYDEDTWYSQAMGWAVTNKILAGDGKTAAAEAPLTRQQLAAALQHWAKRLGAPYQVEERQEMTGVSLWALDAASWAEAAEIMPLMADGSFNGEGRVTGSDLADILVRFSRAIYKDR